MCKLQINLQMERGKGSVRIKFKRNSQKFTINLFQVKSTYHIYKKAMRKEYGFFGLFKYTHTCGCDVMWWERDDDQNNETRCHASHVSVLMQFPIHKHIRNEHQHVYNPNNIYFPIFNRLRWITWLNCNYIYWNHIHLYTIWNRAVRAKMQKKGREREKEKKMIKHFELQNDYVRVNEWMNEGIDEWLDEWQQENK